jgi:hypothetical protein
MPRLKLDKDSKSIRLQMIVTRAWLARVNAYAAKNHMTQSQAIRVLIDQALSAMPPASSVPQQPHKRAVPRPPRS